MTYLIHFIINNVQKRIENILKAGSRNFLKVRIILKLEGSWPEDLCPEGHPTGFIFFDISLILHTKNINVSCLSSQKFLTELCEIVVLFSNIIQWVNFPLDGVQPILGYLTNNWFQYRLILNHIGIVTSLISILIFVKVSFLVYRFVISQA